MLTSSKVHFADMHCLYHMQFKTTVPLDILSVTICNAVPSPTGHGRVSVCNGICSGHCQMSVVCSN